MQFLIKEKCGPVAWVAVRSKAVVLLLLLYCFMFLLLFYGVLCWYALLCVLSSFAIILTRRNAGCFALIVFLLSCCCLCSVALPNCTMSWYAVCDCGIY